MSVNRQKPSLVLDDRLDSNKRNKCKPRASNNGHRQNIDHLLGFQLPPRAPPPPRRLVTRHAASQNIKSPSFIRDRFIHARYRFVMNPMGDYTAHFCDPDIHFHWPDVLQVLVASTPVAASATLSDAAEQENFCPICLNEPSAPRMTKCGHIFCYPCLLHLFGISDAGKWSKCPVCSDTIHTKDLKSVHFTNNLEAISTVGSTEEYVDLTLMQRPQLTTLALPRSATWPSEAVPHLATPWHFSPDAFTYARFMLATPDYMLHALAQDKRELDMLSPPGSHDFDASFVEAARTKVAEQSSKAEGLKTPSILAAKRKSLREIDALCVNNTYQPEASTSGTSSCEDLEDSRQILPLTAPTPKQRKTNVNPQPADTSFYFYQASTGANVFLHPLDIKILKSHYSSYSDFPNTLRVKVEGKEEGSANDDLRRRCRYLSHLPASSDITFLEVEWETLLPPKALEAYANALRTRRNRRRDRIKRDDRAKARAEEKDRQKLVDDVFRQNADARSAAVHPNLSAASAGAQSVPFDMSVFRARLQDTDNDSMPGGSPPSPNFNNTHLPQNDANRTVWGTRAVAASQAFVPSDNELDGNDADDGRAHWENAWADWETAVLHERIQPKLPGGQRKSPPQSTPANSSTGPASATPPVSSRKKAKKITLALGSGGRGRS